MLKNGIQHAQAYVQQGIFIFQIKPKIWHFWGKIDLFSKTWA